MASRPLDSERRLELERLSGVFMPVAGMGQGRLTEPHGLWLRASEAAVASIDVVICGCAWRRSSGPITAGLSFALRREIALALLRFRRGLRVHAIYRLPPPVQLGATTRAGIRSAMLGGFLVELWGSKKPMRVIDAAASAAGVATPIAALRPGSGLSWLAVTASKRGHDVIFRVALSDTPGDPSRAAGCLDLLQESDVDTVPRLNGSGEVSGASWSTESILKGREPRELSASLFSQVVRFCTSLPRSTAPPVAPGDDLDLIEQRCPDVSPALGDLHERLNGDLHEIAGILRHGDLWTRNLLVEADKLTGVVDWDAWHPSGAPGTDLIYLSLAEMWRRERRSLGELWAGRPWRKREFAVRTAPYWTALGLEPDGSLLDAIAGAAWAAQVASNLRRIPRLAQNPRWREKNITNVLKHLTPDHATIWKD
jgi:Phosphotransferase enzyme family